AQAADEVCRVGLEHHGREVLVVVPRDRARELCERHAAQTSADGDTARRQPGCPSDRSTAYDGGRRRPVLRRALHARQVSGASGMTQRKTGSLLRSVLIQRFEIAVSVPWPMIAPSASSTIGSNALPVGSSTPLLPSVLDDPASG